MRKPVLGLAAATAALTLGIAGAAPAATPNQTFDFNNSLEPSFDRYGDGEPLTPFGTTGNETDATYGAVRGFDADSGFTALLQTGTAHTVSMFFNVDDADPDDAVADSLVELVDFTPSNTSVADLYLRDGMLAYRNRDNDGDASNDTYTTGGAIGDNAWRRLVITREADGSRKVYLGDTDTPTLTVPAAQVQVTSNAFSVFGGASSGEIGRLRTWDGALTGTEVESLALGVDDIDPSNITLYEGEGSVLEGTTRWVGPGSYFGGTVVDDGSVPNVTLQLVNAGGAVVGSEDAFNYPTQQNTFNTVLSSWSGGLSLNSFANDATGKLRVIAKDARGNDTQRDFDFKVDKQAPTGFSVDSIGETTSRKPTVTGKANVGPRDSRFVFVTLCKGDNCEFNVKGDYIASARAEVKDGKFSTSEWKRYDETTDRSVDMGDQPNGDYVILGEHGDQLGNYAETKQKLKIVDPKPAVVTPPPPPVVAPVMPTIQQLMQRVMVNAKAILQRLKLASFVRTAKATLPAETNRPGTFHYQFFYGSKAPAKVDPKAKAAQKKKKKKAKKKAKPSNLIAAGRKAFPVPGAGNVSVTMNARGKRLLRRAKKAKVVVRAIFVPTTGPAVSQDTVVNMKR